MRAARLLYLIVNKSLHSPVNICLRCSLKAYCLEVIVPRSIPRCNFVHDVQQTSHKTTQIVYEKKYLTNGERVFLVDWGVFFSEIAVIYKFLIWYR